MTIYCLDTNALIEPWRRRYPIDVFPGFWDRLEEWAREGKAICPDEVLEELQKVDDELLEWAKQRSDMFLPPESDVQNAVKRILERFPRLVDTKRGRDRADPWVIGLACVKDAIVVTEEPLSGGKSPRIPDVCEALGIRYIRVLDLIRVMKLRFA